jgi:hypothetical protein
MTNTERVEAIRKDSIMAFDEFYRRNASKFETRNELSRSTDAWDSAINWAIEKFGWQSLKGHTIMIPVEAKRTK